MAPPGQRRDRGCNPEEAKDADDRRNEPGVKANRERRGEPKEREEQASENHRDVDVDALFQYHG